MLLFVLILVNLVIAFLLWKVSKTLKEVILLLKKLDKPTKEERIAAMSLKEGQKEAIRVEGMFEDRMRLFSRILVNDLAKAINYPRFK